LAERERRHQTEVLQARREGVAEGYQQAREEASAELNEIHNRVAQALSDLAGAKRKLRNEAEGELISLSLAIARRILHREVSIDPEALHGLIHTALQKLQNREISRVRVYPAGADAVRSALERIGAAPAIQVFPDPGLKSGGIVFETSFGELDASVDSQLQEIQRGFADRLSLR
jgi:flagellar assembly protein FliH